MLLLCTQQWTTLSYHHTTTAWGVMKQSCFYAFANCYNHFRPVMLSTQESTLPLQWRTKTTHLLRQSYGGHSSTPSNNYPSYHGISNNSYSPLFWENKRSFTYSNWFVHLRMKLLLYSRNVFASRHYGMAQIWHSQHPEMGLFLGLGSDNMASDNVEISWAGFMIQSMFFT